MTNRRPSRGVVTLLVLALAACGGDSTGPSTGSLAVTISGLPGGSGADVQVTGPGGYSRALGASTTLSGLASGSYTVTADAVTSGSSVYVGDPPSQSVTVSSGSTPAAAEVSYSASSASLSVTITGLPQGADAAVEVTGPGGYQASLTASATLSGLDAGSYTVTANGVSAGGSQYTPTPASQQVAVGGQGEASASVTYVEDGVAGLNYRIDGVYLTQSVQTYGGTVPLIAGRDGYLRVFVTASEANTFSPDVRVRFYHAGIQVSEQTLVRVGPTPLAPEEGTLSSSWNLAVSKTLIQPGLSLRVEVDPANLVAETNEGDNSFPASGLPLIPEVRTAATFQVALVPVATMVDGRTGNVTPANKDQFFTGAMKMHPLSTYDAVVGAPLTVPDNVPALQSDNGNNSWNTILSQLDTRRTADGSSRYYLGIVNPPYNGGVAGIGYVGYPVALAWDKLPSAASVAAHEWGHNWGRQHAPCGGAGNPDGNYPYAGGVIGVYGMDVALAALKPTSSHDLMGYCNNEWISDYTYRAVMQFRGPAAGVASDLGQAVQPALVVWGRVEDGRLVLEPAFQATTRPRLPERDGPYLLEARAEDGSSVFSLRFDPIEVADDRRGARHFSFAVPLAAERVARVAELRVQGEGQTAALRRTGSDPGRVEVSRAGPGRLALRWDAGRTPMVVVRDPRTGQVLSFARGGRAVVQSDQPELVLSLSNRLQSRDLLVRAR